MNECFFMMDTDHMEQEPINFFSQEAEEEEIIFYSQSIIQTEGFGDDY